MKIIDAHLHYAARDYFREAAEAAGHLNSAEHLDQVFAELGVVQGVVMSSGGDAENLNPSIPDLAGPGLPANLVYCCGVNSSQLTPENTPLVLDYYRRHLERANCVGLKFYPGYQHLYLSDLRHTPFFELAEEFAVPVVIHTGDTAGTRGILKYAHPLTVDEVAMAFPRVQFVIAHFGNPWAMDAAQVAIKNENVAIDLSGLAQGRFELEAFMSRYHGYIEYLRTWLGYLSRYDKILYGSDWPLVNLADYIAFIARLVPEEHHQAVFCDNAARIFKLKV